MRKLEYSTTLYLKDTEFINPSLSRFSIYHLIKESVCYKMMTHIELSRGWIASTIRSDHLSNKYNEDESQSCADFNGV